MWIAADAGYDGPRLAFLLADLPVKMLVRMRSDRVLRRRAPSEPTGTGRPPRHGGEFLFVDPAGWGTPDAATVTDTRLQAFLRRFGIEHTFLTLRPSAGPARNYATRPPPTTGPGS